MNLFETVKQTVSPMEAAQYYGLGANRGGMICCPFHEDHTPSLKLYEDHYYCFGCGASGDVIRLTAQIFGITPYEAARKLAQDFGIDPTPPPAALALRPPKVKNTQRFYHRLLRDYANLLRRNQKNFPPEKPGEIPDDRFVEACRSLSRVEDLIDSLEREPEKTIRELENDGTMHRIAQVLDQEEKARWAA